MSGENARSIDSSSHQVYYKGIFGALGMIVIVRIYTTLYTISYMTIDLFRVVGA